MNTKRDYQRAAEIVRVMRGRGAEAYEETRAVAAEWAFVTFFAGDNPRFDANAFRSACAVPSDPPKNTRVRNTRK